MKKFINRFKSEPMFAAIVTFVTLVPIFAIASHVLLFGPSPMPVFGEVTCVVSEFAPECQVHEDEDLRIKVDIDGEYVGLSVWKKDTLFDKKIDRYWGLADLWSVSHTWISTVQTPDGGITATLYPNWDGSWDVVVKITPNYDPLPNTCSDRTGEFIVIGSSETMRDEMGYLDFEVEKDNIHLSREARDYGLYFKTPKTGEVVDLSAYKSGWVAEGCGLFVNIRDQK